MLPRVQSRIGDYLAARVQYIRTRQFGQHDASQSITNATDASRRSRFDRRSESFSIASAMALSTAPIWLVKCKIVASARA